VNIDNNNKMTLARSNSLTAEEETFLTNLRRFASGNPWACIENDPKKSEYKYSGNVFDDDNNDKQ
jgi:hypothetical protein